MNLFRLSFLFFFFNDTATTEIYTLSLHDALPISFSRAANSTFSFFPRRHLSWCSWKLPLTCILKSTTRALAENSTRSEEHTSELQSRLHLVCRLLLEKKKTNKPLTCDCLLSDIYL